MASQKKPWFAPKRIGYGTGLPISWEGWLVLALYFIGVLLAIRTLPTLGTLAVVTILSAVLLIVCAKRTDGGWRWRDGS